MKIGHPDLDAKSYCWSRHVLTTRSSPNRRRIRSLPQAGPLRALAMMLVPQPFGLGFGRVRQNISIVCSWHPLRRQVKRAVKHGAPLEPRGPRAIDDVFGDLQCCRESRWRRQQFPGNALPDFMAPFLVSVTVSGSQYTPRLKCRPGRLSFCLPYRGKLRPTNLVGRAHSAYRISIAEPRGTP